MPVCSPNSNLLACCPPVDFHVGPAGAGFEELDHGRRECHLTEWRHFGWSPFVGDHPWQCSYEQSASQFGLMTSSAPSNVVTWAAINPDHVS
jgi:hypothetical protein